MRSRRVFLLPSYNITYPRYRPPFPAPRVSQIGYQFQSYMFSLDSILSLGLFTASVVALVVHKFLIITLHGPLPIVGLLAAGPFLFVFDLITLLFLHQGLASTIRALRLFSSFVALFIMSCSATFVSYYQQANAEVQWGRSVEVFSFSITLTFQDDCRMEILWKTVGSGKWKLWKGLPNLLPCWCRSYFHEASVRKEHSRDRY